MKAWLQRLFGSRRDLALELASQAFAALAEERRANRAREDELIGRLLLTVGQWPLEASRAGRSPAHALADREEDPGDSAEDRAREITKRPRTLAEMRAMADEAELKSLGITPAQVSPTATSEDVEADDDDDI